MFWPMPCTEKHCDALGVRWVREGFYCEPHADKRDKEVSRLIEVDEKIVRRLIR